MWKTVLNSRNGFVCLVLYCKKTKRMELKTYFENHKQIIETELLEAKSIVYIAVAWINFKEYFDIFNEIINKKIDLNIICSDNKQNRAHEIFVEKLRNKGAKIKLLKMPHYKNHMHHKFVVIDATTIINGSFNWSPNATRSFENLMVIKGATNEAKDFIIEFKKLQLIEKETIKKLTKLKKCEYCDDGKLVNILVFSSKSSKYFETSGDIVEVCSDCDYFDNSSDMITNNQLFLLADHYNSVNEESEYNSINDSIFDELNQYINNGKVIHAIGQVFHELDQFDEDNIFTKILWENKLIEGRIQDIYDEQDFDVNYDKTSYL